MTEGPVLKVLGYCGHVEFHSYLTKRMDGKGFETSVRLLLDNDAKGIQIPFSEIEKISAWVNEVQRWRAVERVRLDFPPGTDLMEIAKRPGGRERIAHDALIRIQRDFPEARIAQPSSSRIDVRVNGELFSYYATTGRIRGSLERGVEAFVSFLHSVRETTK